MFDLVSLIYERLASSVDLFVLYTSSPFSSDSQVEPNSTLKVAELAAKELGITQLVPAIYQDLLQPAAREVGQQFVVVAKAVGVALAPLHVTVWGFDHESPRECH